MNALKNNVMLLFCKNPPSIKLNKYRNEPSIFSFLTKYRCVFN